MQATNSSRLRSPWLAATDRARKKLAGVSPCESSLLRICLTNVARFVSCEDKLVDSGGCAKTCCRRASSKLRESAVCNNRMRAAQISAQAAAALRMWLDMAASISS